MIIIIIIIIIVSLENKLPSFPASSPQTAAAGFHSQTEQLPKRQLKVTELRCDFAALNTLSSKIVHGKTQKKLK